MYRRPQIRGRGDYRTFFGRMARKGYSALQRAVPKGTGAAIGRAIGAAAGRAAAKLTSRIPYVGGALSKVAPGVFSKYGRKVGGFLGAQGAKITGVGDYTVHHNTLIGAGKPPPHFGDESIRVRKREYLTNLDMGTGFTNNAFIVNPGRRATFPWLSQIALAYEQYCIVGMIFEFVSTSSTAIASTSDLSLGQIVAATDYDVNDNDYTSQSQMLNSYFANSGKPSNNLTHAIECAKNDQAFKLYFVHDSSSTSLGERRQNDYCKTQFATVGTGTTNYDNAGQVWISYDVILKKPVFNRNEGLGQFGAQFRITNFNDADVGATTVWTQDFNTLDVEVGHDGTTTDELDIQFPSYLDAGTYLITLRLVGTTATITAPSLTRFQCSEVAAWNDPPDDGFVNSPVNGVNSVTFISLILIRIIDFGARATLDFSSAVTPVNADATLTITQYPENSLVAL